MSETAQSKKKTGPGKKIAIFKIKFIIKQIVG